MGSPTTMATLLRRGSLAPGGIAASVPAIPTGTTRLLRLNFDVDPTVEVDDETELCFTENAGGNLFTYLDGLVAVIPENECLTATFTELVDQPFTRGDVDGNGVVFPLGDVVYLLDWFFTGGIEPPCLKAADVDDDGNLFGLLDAIYLLEWGFTNGPLPPDPGPLDCGFDPTPDTIFCFTAGCTP